MSFGHTAYSQQDYQKLQQDLSKNLGPEYLSERTGPGNTKLKYLEGWKLGNLANEILGFNGWSHSIISQTVDFVDVQDGKYSLGISTVVRVTLKDGSYHEDCGYGSIDNCRQKAMAFEKAKKESVTDALKRTLKHFGNVLGNCVYSKEYLKRVGKMGKGGKQEDLGTLYRAPGFREEPSVPSVSVPQATIPKPQPLQAPNVNFNPNHIATAAERDEFGYSDDDEALLMAADLECISVDMLQETIPCSVNETLIKILPESVTNPQKNSIGSIPKFQPPTRPPLNTSNAAANRPLARPPVRPVAQPNKQFMQNQKSSLEPKPFTRSRSSPKYPLLT